MVITDNLSSLHFLPFILLFGLNPLHLYSLKYNILAAVPFHKDFRKSGGINREKERRQIAFFATVNDNWKCSGMGKMMGHLNEENIYLNYVVVFRQRFNDNKTRFVKQIIKK